MIRRIVCLLLVPALLANQAAMCCAHAHYGSETDDHSARSHVHLPGHAHHLHSHEPASHGESSHDHDHGVPSDDTESKLNIGLNSPVDHDNDAIYFDSDDIVQNQSNRLTLEYGPIALVWFVAEPPRMAIPNNRTQVTRAGLFSLLHCALFLQTRCLLI